MSTCVIKEFLDVGFTKMKKNVLYDKCISAHALFESRSYERSLISFFLFSYLFSLPFFFIVWFVTVRERNVNIQLRFQGFSPPRRERSLLGGEEPWERHWKIICTFWVIVLRIKILGSNPQKFVNSFLFYSFSWRIFNFFYFEITFKLFLNISFQSNAATLFFHENIEAS